MPRQRANPTLSWLPPRVYVHRENFVYQPKSGGKIILCKTDAHKIEVLKRYEQEKGNIETGVFFERIINDFFKSMQAKELAPRTLKDYSSYAVTLKRVFGRMRPNAIQPHHIRQFMDALALERGSSDKPAYATANRHKACMQKICSWALQVGRIKINPCVGVSKGKESGRTRYISDAEYNAIYKHAAPACRVAMEISYLCMARIGDVANLTMRDVLQEGLFIKQGKTGKEQIKLWSERLSKAVSNARELPRKKGMTTIFLLSKPDGSKYTVRALQAQYATAKKLAGVDGVTLHDLKAKGVSDFEGTLADKQNASGHTTLAQTQKYDRKTKHVRSVK